MLKLSGCCVDVITDQVKKIDTFIHLGKTLDKSTQNYERFTLIGDYNAYRVFMIMMQKKSLKKKPVLKAQQILVALTFF